MQDNSGKPLSTSWSIAEARDIGAGFRRADKAARRKLIERDRERKHSSVDDVYRRIQYQTINDERQGKERHPFLNGNSKFIFYVLKPPKKQVAPKRKIKEPINYHTKVSPTQRVKFSSGIVNNIDKTSKFFMEEILPRTQSLLTAIANVDEMMQQLTDERAQLPIEFVKSKMREATQLRIIRYIADQFGLNPKELRLLQSEYIAKMRPPLF